MATTDIPKLITVPQAAHALRIGRSTAYDLAHAWLDSKGAEGLPVVRIGRTMRVPVAALDRLFAIGGFGPAWNSGLDRRRGPREHTVAASTATSVPMHSKAKPAASDQLRLFDIADC